MSCTIRWRTTSLLVRCTNASPSMPRQHLLEPEQTTAAALHVDLGDVAGDDDLRPEADAREEHLHLLGRRVLRLVEDDEAAVQRAPAHEGQRRDLDGSPFEQPLRALGFEHVVERVVQRTKIRVDLGHDVAGQEAEALAGLDRGPREDDAVDVFRLQRLHAHRDREPALARARGTDAERDHVLADGVHVALLPAGLRPHGATARRPQHLGGQHLGRTLVRLHHVDGARHARRLEPMALLQQDHQLLEQPADPIGLGRIAVDRDLVAADVDLDIAERAFDQPQQLVTLTEQTGHQVVAGNGDLDLRGIRRCDLTRITSSVPSACGSNPAASTADGLLGGDLVARLDRWVAEMRSDDAAASRARERWLLVQAEESSTFAGVLLDLGEQRCDGRDRGPRRSPSSRHDRRRRARLLRPAHAVGPRDPAQLRGHRVGASRSPVVRPDRRPGRLAARHPRRSPGHAGRGPPARARRDAAPDPKGWPASCGRSGGTCSRSDSTATRRRRPTSRSRRWPS